MDYHTRPFSLQRISLRGQRYGKKVGSWFGPTDAAYVIRDIVRSFASQCSLNFLLL
jgi:hypothetical protein